MKLLRTLSSLAIIATLAACATTQLPPAVGSWTIDLQTPNGARTATLNIADDGTGTLASEQLGDSELADLMMEGNAVSFGVPDNLAGIPLLFTGTVEGDALSGEFGTPMGALPVSGTSKTRSPQSISLT